ncbi:MAG: hypothetical protein Q8L11_00540 [Candidatus Moranbacteria bacterium]|nr:hypothetical protein [Candidatus Moranbacteria bacterium]
MKKIMLIAIAIIVFVSLVVGLWTWSSAAESKEAVATPVTTDKILFYGKECPHCHDVEKFIEDNKITEKVRFDSLEVWHNDANKKFFLEKIKECGIAEEKAGVPMLYARGECLIGTPDIEGFFRQEAGIQD